MIETVLRSEDLPVADRFEWWQELTSHTLTPTEITSDHADDFRACVRLLDLGAVQVSVLSYPSLRSRRTPALVRRSDPELYHLALTLRGRQSISHCRRDALVGVGDLLLYDTSHPYDASAFPDDDGTVEGIVVNVPRAAFPLPAAKVDRLLAAPLPGDTGMGALLSQFLLRLAPESDSCRPQDAIRLGGLTVDLITAFLAHHADTEDGVPPESRHHALMVGIHSFIERNLGDLKLSPSAVAASHHISVRYLHRLFQPQGITVSAWIRQRRLERCRRDLADPRLSDRPIGFLAARWGFVHASEFTRAFRRAYGIPPSTYRQDALRSEPCIDRPLRASSGPGDPMPR
ncbi:helix-turn-helix domain-containing protein [Streptomyces asoensis]|uniref:Helix-turn-helix domain-containing protein n=1 Tax=Streptomyces asoensis TaxID=249586 RepID=A0A6M4WEV3_9ACTN|nr:helix-turn-helix domain-containing protein [Streptomyces asoensis]QJS99186.1 helix-turn-helix domain-containing protein [Streptomyces asoensis]